MGSLGSLAPAIPMMKTPDPRTGDYFRGWRRSFSTGSRSACPGEFLLLPECAPLPGPIHPGNASRRPLLGCRIGARQTSTPDPQSRTQACAQAAPGRSRYRRSVHLFHGPVPPSSFCHRSVQLCCISITSGIRRRRLPSASVFCRAR